MQQLVAARFEEASEILRTIPFFACLVALWCLSACASAAAEVTPYPLPPGDAPSDDFSVSVEGVPVDCTATEMKVDYAHFAFRGKVRVSIRAAEPIASYDLSPHRLGIQAEVRGNVLEFDIQKPCKLHLRINLLPRLFLFAEAPEKNSPDTRSADVRPLAEFGVSSSHAATQTRAIQNALDVTAARGQTLVVPPGIYRTGSLKLPSGLRLYIAAGAILKGTARMEDYQLSRGEQAQLLLSESTNVRIFGRGTIDNNGLALRSQFLPDRDKGRVRMLLAKACRDITVEGVILRDSAVWCVHTVQSRDMRFRNLKIISASRAETGPDTSHNTDAFDPDNSSNVLIENNFISVDDDAIAIKLARGERADMRNIVFRDNVVWTTCAALKIGTEVHDYTIRNVLFENNDIIHADSAIVVQCYRGGYVNGARWIGNYFEQVGTVANNSPHRKGANFYINAKSRDNFGEIRNLLIKNNTFERFSDRPSMIRGAKPNQVVENVRFENLVIDGKHRTSASAAGIKLDKDVTTVEFR